MNIGHFRNDLDRPIIYQMPLLINEEGNIMLGYKKLGEFLKEKRVDAGLTQPALAQKLGEVHSQFVSNWERGLCAPPSHAFQRLISVLSLNRDELVKVMVADYQSEVEFKVFKKKARVVKRSK